MTHEDAAAGTTLAAAALDYAAAGLPVFPLHSCRDGRCSCGTHPCKDAAKHPRTTNGLHDATTNVARVASWWQRWPSSNIGIPTGNASGYVVVDVDPRHGGEVSLERLEREHGRLGTARVLTGSGGAHLYLRRPDGELRNSTGRLGAGLDVRADGGYIVAPPSVHASGNPYKWIRPLETGVADVPSWLLDRAKATNGAAPSVAETIPEGSRNSELASIAGTMRRRGMREQEILAALLETNRLRCTPPLPESEVTAIAASVAAYAPGKVPSDAHLEPFALHVATAAWFCAQPDTSSGEELLGPWVIRSYRIIVGGHTGEGKTTIGLAIVRAIVTGGELLGFTGSGDARALVLDAEQGAKSLKRRLREAGLHDRDDVDVIRVPDGLELDSDPRHVAEVERVLERGGYSVVAVDPLYKLHSGDSNAEREAVNLMRRFDGWRERFNFALVLPVHCRKPIPGLKFSIHDIFGSSAYVRGAEVVVGVQRLRDGYSKLHWLKDRDGDLPIGTSWGLLFNRDEGFRRDPSDGKRETAADKLRALLVADPQITNQQLEAALGVTDRTIRRLRKELDQQGQADLFDLEGEE